MTTPITVIMYTCGKRRKSKTSSKLRTIDLLDEKLQNMCLNIPEKDKHNLASAIINRVTTHRYQWSQRSALI